MYVPSDSFGGISPEKKAASALRTLFTFTAVKIVLAQLEGSGRGNLASYNKEHSDLLLRLLEQVPFKDGDDWLQVLLQENSMLGLRVAEVREAYAKEDFEWDQLQRLALEQTKAANLQLMRSSVLAKFTVAEKQQQAAPLDAPAGSASAENEDGAGAAL